MALKYIDEVSKEIFQGSKILCRLDLNVPLKNGIIQDSTRIDEALDTINYLLSCNPKKLIIVGHLGRPKGERKEELSLAPVGEYLAEKIGQEIILTESAVDRGIKTQLELPKGKIILLENIRFEKGETKGDKELASTLASYADFYVNDAFGTCHRKHASTYEINSFFKNKAYAGFLLKKEIIALNKIVERPKTPFVAIIGGAKVSDKIKVIESLLTNVTDLLIGGAMAYPFLAAKGHKIGKSLCSKEDISLAKKILSTPNAQKIHLPLDHVVSDDINGAPGNCAEIDIAESMIGLDIGTKTKESYKKILETAQTVLWNGPMGMFENENYSKGTFFIAEILSTINAYTLVGGGDSVSALKKSGLADKISHVSTGGGASLEYIENGTLPGIQALKFGIN
ncbi:MAG: phosphoglycerate kinase [Halobacteriovoraceae bacterium]|nr:phosphoglycerate kinase [Halobacteriovoraceae bacterium]